MGIFLLSAIEYFRSSRNQTLFRCVRHWFFVFSWQSIVSLASVVYTTHKSECTAFSVRVLWTVSARSLPVYIRYVHAHTHTHTENRVAAMPFTICVALCCGIVHCLGRMLVLVHDSERMCACVRFCSASLLERVYSLAGFTFLGCLSYKTFNSRVD